MKATFVFIVLTYIAGSALYAGVLTGPITNPDNRHTYYLLTEDTWQNSETQAVLLGGHLSTINDQAEQDWVFATFSSFGGTNRSLWIGLSDASQEGRFSWVSGEPVSYTHWYPNQPDNAFGGENYVHMIPGGVGETPGFWNDLASPDNNRADFRPLCGVVEVGLPSLTIEVSQVRLCWNSQTNKLYQVQCRSDLTTNQWVALGAPVQGDGTATCMTADVTVPRRFYRLIVLP